MLGFGPAQAVKQIGAAVAGAAIGEGVIVVCLASKVPETPTILSVGSAQAAKSFTASNTTASFVFVLSRHGRAQSFTRQAVEAIPCWRGRVAVVGCAE